MTTTPRSDLAIIDELERRLADIQTPIDAKNESDRAGALQALARSLGLSLEQQNRICEHRLRTQRRGGELLTESEVHRGGAKSHDVTLADFGLDKMESSRWQSLARMPEEVFERYIAAAVEGSGVELTVSGALKLARRPTAPRPVPKTVESASDQVLPLERFMIGATPAQVITSIVRTLLPSAKTALDPTYGLGNFHDGTLGLSVAAHDKEESRAPDGVMLVEDLDYEDASIDVVLFDPPHLADLSEDSIMGERFGTMSQEDIDNLIINGTRECWRVCRIAIVVKITDSVHGGVFQEESALVGEALNWSTPYEKVHQVRARGVVDPRWEAEHDRYSAYNNGSTYLVFKKGSQVHGSDR
jgi:hypothetical protein